MDHHRRAAPLAGLLCLCLLALPGRAPAYPLDGYESTGIGRLLHQRLIQEGEIPGKKRPSGELLPLARVDLRLLDHPDLELPPPDPKLTAKLKKLIGPEVDRYGIALLDLSDIANPRYAEWQRPPAPEPRQRRQAAWSPSPSSRPWRTPTPTTSRRGGGCCAKP